MTAATMTETATKQVETYFYKLKLAETPLEALIGKLLASNLFDTAQQHKIKNWHEIFAKKFPEMPKDDAEKDRAAFSIFYLLETFVRPNYANPNADWHAIEKLEIELEGIIKTYLPKNETLENWIKKCRTTWKARASLPPQIAQIERLYVKAIAQLEKEFLDEDFEIEKHFEMLKKRIEAVLQAIDEASDEMRKRLAPLKEKIQKICQIQFSQNAKQQKIVEKIEKLNKDHKAILETTQNVTQRIKG